VTLNLDSRKNLGHLTEDDEKVAKQEERRQWQEEVTRQAEELATRKARQVELERLRDLEDDRRIEREREEMRMQYERATTQETTQETQETAGVNEGLPQRQEHVEQGTPTRNVPDRRRAMEEVQERAVPPSPGVARSRREAEVWNGGDRQPPYDERQPPYDERQPHYNERQPHYDDRQPHYDDRQAHYEVVEGIHPIYIYIYSQPQP